MDWSGKNVKIKRKGYRVTARGCTGLVLLREVDFHATHGLHEDHEDSQEWLSYNDQTRTLFKVQRMTRLFAG
jgi:hypothetical protein